MLVRSSGELAKMAKPCRPAGFQADRRTGWGSLAYLGFFGATRRPWRADSLPAVL
jgi:hypothetical protein